VRRDIGLAMRKLGLLAFTTLALSACGGGIDGDWQLCLNSACSSFDTDALRLRDDDTFVVVDTEQRCEAQSTRRNGTYRYEDESLTIYPFDGDIDSVQVSLDGDRAVFSFAGERLLWERTDFGELATCEKDSEGGTDDVPISKPSQPSATDPMTGGGGT
jgi:hypothetical protein